MKPIISRDEFIKHINGVQMEDEAIGTLYDLGIDMIEAKWNYSNHHFTELLSMLVGDTEEWVGWWCWETDFGKEAGMTKVYDSKREEEIADIRTPGDLYDFIVNNYGDEEDGGNKSE